MARLDGVTVRSSQQARRLTQAVLDLLFPPRCAVCRRAGVELCPACRASFIPLGEKVCAVCSLPLPAAGRCGRCAAQPPAFSRVQSGYRYEGAVRQAVLALKYRGRRELADPLAQALADMCAPPPASFVLCPVPQHVSRQAERGYNHAGLLAEALARRWERTLLPPGALQRHRPTPTQVGSDYESRLANVRGAFLADRAEVAGLCLLLVDDVCTTGATLSACAETLLAAGAAAVCGVTLARTA